MAGKNNIVRRVRPNTLFADIKNLLNVSVSFNQGDFLIMDTSNHILAAPADETDGANFVGCAVQKVVSGKLPSIYTTDVDAAVAAGAISGPEFGDEYSCVLKSGDTLHAGDKVYLHPATGTRGVQASGTKAIGVYEGPTVTGDGVAEIVCKLGARYPSDALIF